MRSTDGRVNDESDSTDIVAASGSGRLPVSPTSMTRVTTKEMVSIEHLFATHVFTNPQHLPAEYIRGVQEVEQMMHAAINEVLSRGVVTQQRAAEEVDH